MNVSRCAHSCLIAFAVPRLAAVGWVLGSLILVGGCRLCADCDDDAYASYGGAWQRTNRDAGRVGSVFDPGGSRASDLSQRAESDGLNASNRAGVGAEDAADSSDRDSAAPSQNKERDIMDTDGEEPPEEDREEELKALEKRYRNLQLEEIKHERLRTNAGQWQ